MESHKNIEGFSNNKIKPGEIYNSLKVLDFAYSKNKRKYWRCECLCGENNCTKKLVVRASRLKSGKIKKCNTGKRPYKDLSGKKFGRLKALFPFCTLNKKQNKIKWVCICDCGKLTEVISQNLRTGTTKSCGCLLNSPHKTNKGKGHGVSGLNYLYSNYKMRSNKACREFHLTKEYFKILTSSNCHYCGREPSQKIQPSSYKQEYKGDGAYIYNGIDRVDCSSGYTIENSVPCCKICNRAKLGMSYSDFLKWIQRFQDADTILLFSPKFTIDNSSNDNVIRLPKGVSGLNNLIGKYKARSKTIGVEFKLNDDEFKILTSSKCHYCKVVPYKVHSIKSKDYREKGRINSEYAYNGLDRVDNEMEYSSSNCVPCCQICNYAKLDMPYAEFIEWINQLKSKKFKLSKDVEALRKALLEDYKKAA